MSRQPPTTMQAFDAALRTLQGCSSALSRVRIQLGDIDITRPNAYSQLSEASQELRSTKDDHVDALEHLRDARPHLAELQERGDDYKQQCRDLSAQVNSLGQTLATERQRANQSEQSAKTLQAQLQQSHNELYQTQQAGFRYENIVREQEQTIRKLGDDLLRARRSSTGHSTFLPVPTSPDAATRPSSDSGFSSDGSTVTDPGQRFRQKIAQNLINEGTVHFKRAAYAEADKSFKEAETMINLFPIGVRAAFNIPTLAYHRAVCEGETGLAKDVEVPLDNFLQSYDRASHHQKAHIQHLLARTLVKLGRLGDAMDHACASGGLWNEISPSSDHYFDAVALVVRIYHLQEKPQEALAVLREFSREEQDYIRARYANLKPSTSTTSSRPAFLTPAPQSGRPTTLPTRPSRTPRSAPSTASGASGSSRKSTRQQNLDKLPWIFRKSLT